MLRPTKHSHPDRTVIYTALIMINRLKSTRIESYSELLQLIKSKVCGGDVLFLPALNFLFLMGLVEYRQKTDSIEYIENKNETF